MRVKALFSAALVAVALVTTMAVPSAQQPQDSSALVKQLVSAMAARQLDVVAAIDPDEPGRFLGAMVFPGVQMMVTSTRHKQPEYVTEQLGKRQFRTVYDALQYGLPAGRLLFHDLGCDGFKAGGDSIDLYYEDANTRTLLDGNYLAQGMTEEQYAQKQRDAEAKYVRSLTILLDAVKKLPIITVP